MRGHARSQHPNRKNSLGLFHCMSQVVCFISLHFISGCPLHIFVRYQFLIMSSKCSGALSRLEDHNTCPNRVQKMNNSSMTVREYLRRPRSLIGPLWTKMFLSHIIQRGARRSLPRSKDQQIFKE